MTQFLQIESPKRAAQAEPQPIPVLRLGFRPFYLLAAIYAALSVPLWVAQYGGWLAHGSQGGALVHAHEMVFGFALAVIVGFLFTAVRNWTNAPTPTGPLLAAIAALWIAARVLAYTPYAGAAAFFDVAFPLAAAAGIAVPLVRSGNRRNYFFVAVLALMALAAGVSDLAALGAITLPAWVGVRVALDAVLFVMAVMGGRVIPMFTNNGVPGTNARRDPRVEQLALGSVLALLALDALQVDGWALFAVATVAALAHGVRLALWQPWRTLAKPIVWVLHAGYAWIVVYLALRALGALGLVASPLATHALTIGAIGGLTIGMMTRTARGHTGRPLQPDRWEVTAYALVLGAAVVRVFGPMILPPEYLRTVECAAVLWAAGYALYAIRYWPVLTRPRIDGRPG